MDVMMKMANEWQRSIDRCNGLEEELNRQREENNQLRHMLLSTLAHQSMNKGPQLEEEENIDVDCVIGEYEKPRIEMACRDLEKQGLDLKNKGPRGTRTKIAKILSFKIGQPVVKCLKYLSERDYDNNKTQKEILEVRKLYEDLGIECSI